MTNQSYSTQPLPAKPDEEELWQAVLHRDRASGRFVYAVQSTRIYCKPSCPSRRPNRSQVIFFESGEAAQRAGFRACRRCRPDTNSAPDSQIQMVERARELLDADAEEAISLRALGSALGISPYHLQRTFKASHGRHAATVCRVSRRLARFKQNVKSGRWSDRGFV